MAHTVSLVTIFAVCAVALVSGTGLTDISLGKCVDNKKDQNNFRMDQFLGTWYENATLNRLPYTAGHCGTVEYTLNPAEDTANVKETEIVNNEEIVYNSKLYKINLIDYYRYFTVYAKTEHLPYKPNLKLLFKLLGTDYDCWAVVYTCIGEPAIHKEIVSVLLRSRAESCLNEKTNTIVETLVKEVLSKDFYTEFSFNNHTGCKVEEPVVEEEERAENDVLEPEKPATDANEKTAKEGKEPTAAKEEKKGNSGDGEKEFVSLTERKEQKAEKTEGMGKEQKAEKTEETGKEKKAEKTEVTGKKQEEPKQA